MGFNSGFKGLMASHTFVPEATEPPDICMYVCIYIVLLFVTLNVLERMQLVSSDNLLSSHLVNQTGG